MKEIYNSYGMIVSYLEETSFFKQSFTPETKNWTDNSYKEQFEEYAKLIREYKPLYIIVDTQNFMFSVIPEIQVWQSNYINPLISEIGVKKIAMLMNDDFITQISIEQTLEENEENNSWETKFFSNEDEAITWLLK